MGALNLVAYSGYAAAVFAWSFRYLFDNSFLHAYTVKSKIHRSKINAVLADLNKRYYCSIPPVDIDDEALEKDNFYRGDAAVPSRPSATAAAALVVRILFSLTVTLSIQLMTLIMTQVVQQHSDAQVSYFHFTIDALVVVVSFLVPWIAVALAISHHLYPRSSGTAAATLALYASWFLVLHKCGDLSQSFAPDSSSYRTRSLLDKKINQISIVGITVIAILSGIGSSSTICNQWPSWKRQFRRLSNQSVAPPPIVSETAITNLVAAHNNTTRLVNKRNAELNDILVSTGGTVYNQKDASPADNALAFHGGKRLGGIMHKVQSFASLSSLSLGKGNAEESELTEEINNLRNLRDSIYGDLTKQVSRFIAIKEHNSSWTAKLTGWLNVIFSFYCVYRIVNVFLIKLPYHYWLSEGEVQVKEDAEATKDALAITLARVLIGITRTSISETIVVNQLSFILSGSLFLCSFSNVLITLRSVGSMVPIGRFSAEVKNWLKHLAISELLAVYAIATCLLIRSNLPYELSVQISKILSLSGSASTSATAIKEIQFIDHWFDLMYAFTTAVTFAVLLVRSAVNSDNQFDDYDEENAIEHVNYKSL